MRWKYRNGNVSVLHPYEMIKKKGFYFYNDYDFCRKSAISFSPQSSCKIFWRNVEIGENKDLICDYAEGIHLSEMRICQIKYNGEKIRIKTKTKSF